MEKVTYAGENQNKIEVFLLTIHSFYSLSMVAKAIRSEWGAWIAVIMTVIIAVCWIVYMGKVKDYTFRAYFSVGSMQISLIIYAISLGNTGEFVPMFTVFAVLIGLYGIPKLVCITVVSITLVYFYHIALIVSEPAWFMQQVVDVALNLANTYLLEYVVYIWTKRNCEGSKQLLAAIEELNTVQNSKDDFLANVSHEIRTPINAICGMSELVLREELPYQIKENVQNIQLAGRNLMAVVSDVLDFSELQSGKIELEEEAYNMTSTINDVINMALARKNDKKIELIVDCDANLPSVLLGDEKKLRRVMLNLLDNAIKFTETGFVSLAIKFRKESYGINLSVTVKDSGIGMDEQSLENLFSSFNQVDTSRKRQEGGIGLGLAISHALVEKMGGAIIVKSKPDRGSSVRFTIPQKVLDETPIASIRDRAGVNVATYIDMEQFDMVAFRDEYTNTIIHMVEQVKGKCHICRNFAELQRREEKERFSHIFTSTVEYLKDKEYFDKLAETTKVVVILDRFDEKQVTNPRLLKIYKPFYILTVVSILNDESYMKDDRYGISMEKFVTKDAHIMVVDDNRMNLRVIEGLLANYNIKVTSANSGQEALEKIIECDYDFIFMDHMMPEMDGVETLQRIRHMVGTYYRKVPVVALTANAVAGTREMLMAEGFSDFVEKPIERSVLERVLKRNLAPEKIVYRERNSGQQTDADVASNGMENMVDVESELAAEGLDVSKGILYCNGKEQYIKVLQGYCQDGDDTGRLAQELFDQRDWTNYVITVHGMKSAMRSIGAIPLSETARLLEMAGKEGRFAFILEHHDELMSMYHRLIFNLRKKKWLYDPEEADTAYLEQETEELSVLEEAVFARFISEMEEAMYTLDDNRLTEIIQELQGYQYNGSPLKTALMPVKRKVEMSDYVSAVELVVRLKKRLEDKEVGE